ncbi:MAG: gspE [Moraxellaceae bacterium]|jgi:pilus assembly protein CpaF|nr:gspE [Moraxellaceae bacterium]
MSLRDQFSSTPAGAETAAESRNDPAYLGLKNRIHRQLLENADLAAMESMSGERLRDEIRNLVQGLLQKEHALVNEAERRQLVSDIQNEVLGLGPLEPLLADPTLSDILVNTADSVYVERRGKLEKTDIRFTDNAHLLKIIDKIVSRIGRRVDESSPMVDARLPDGSRVNAIIPPLAIDGPILSIRRFSVTPLMMQDLIGYKSLTEPMAQVLHGLVRAKVNMLISGGTGSGKTTLLNAMSAAIPPAERIVTIEDAAELQMQQPHVVRLETRPPNIEGKGEVTQRALVRNSLRMRPDRIVIGEVRGAEALDMLQAMNTGHEGSLTTIHANSPRDALTRLENMVSMAGLNLPTRFMRQQVSSAISVVVQISRLSDGHRRITSIQEVTGMEGDVVSMQEIFTFEQTGVSAKGEVEGYFRATGIRPKFIQRLHTRGVDLDEAVFDPSKAYS